MDTVPLGKMQITSLHDTTSSLADKFDEWKRENPRAKILDVKYSVGVKNDDLHHSALIIWYED